MSLVSDKVVSETNFNLTNQLCNLSVGYKLSNLERICATSSPFVYDNYFEKRKIQIQNSLKTNLEEELLKKHLLVDNFQLKNTETDRLVVNAVSNSAAFIGPVSLLAGNFRLKAPSNFSLDSKKSLF